MTTNPQIQLLGYYDYKELYYSGTKIQPDLITVFMKSKGKISDHHVLPIHNWMDLIPFFGVLTAVPRIVAAVKPFFHEAKQIRFQKNDPHLAECWNAFKNLMRGVVALVPLVGTFCLVCVETIRMARDYILIQKSFASQQEIIGVVVDGKVIFSADLNLYRERICGEAFLHLKLLVDSVIKKAKERNFQYDVEHLISRIGRQTNTLISQQNG